MIYIKQFPGATDTEIERFLKKSHQTINQACRSLEVSGYLLRRINPQKNNLIGNYPSDMDFIISHEREPDKSSRKPLQEDEIKHILNDFLINDGWSTKVAWGHQRGIDIDATKENRRWIIEIKGPGSRQPMRVNYFLSILGESLQRMDDADARYSIAFPDLKQYRQLWNKLPILAKQRTTIDLILVDSDGNIYFEK
ncbi:MAG: MarR family transcriptional regulator [Clostridia bacterium]|nr:MarR family transcriptional regulator [Clostridia bacterium]